MTNDSDNFLGKSFQQFQRFVRQSGPAAAASYTLLAAVLFLGALGYFLDQFFNTSPLWLLIGLSLGIVIGFYELAKTVFK
ncbi:MAG: AtpZ/AtpI family protein [Candidatus Marinimicrobia bacterium]|jgi:F0F1-type ATP synthase assembly protein I|nr:AtpZ/AtpI family protein [Candidatus Neomarinimicrobiota bacterium]MDP6611432.1 AtpZ/AtpI family protein [Candidatus Neomarinimicrobiota bacterium]|tara:strand:- start:21575 stop:21814 length:240 start_codon:yes stop_codon:yes gene_type:complete